VLISTPHMVMKFPDERGNIIIVKAKPKVAREYYARSLRVATYFVSSPGKARTSLDLTYPEGAEEPANQDKGRPPKYAT